ncbi:CheY-like chemotaxis protein/nitrogen-specific signal transduction histidine kinase [Brevundimonas alba]|uniref:histidine kinase n=1 Tax=Brevundimonas alba TaxID=74314 RepID=A0A7X6BND3_9CAUL|nr:response regulator [Brevundimonas alba]NJC40834.1 CheY-like chemotaxis protein/nitrogen-specific signal transduction histidine kinase [Brevundimonas alba]
MARKTKPATDMAKPEAAAAEGAEHQFLRLMSHEMRTPLNGVIGMLGLLQRTRLDGAQRAYAEAARSSAEHLLGLVNDLLDYARLEADRLEFDAASVDLETLVRGVAELLSPKAHDKGLEIAWSVAPDAIDVMADEGRLRQVLFNLAGNAVKFTETGGVRISVERAGGSVKRPKLAFIVDDTGPGVPAEARGRIFEEFGHVDASDASRFGGAGLGLAVVRKLADAMGGTVSVADRPDGPGARFRFEAAFPVVKGAERVLSLGGQTVAVTSPDPFVRAAAAAQIEASGGAVATKAPVVLIDHAARQAGQGMVSRPSDARAIVLLKPSERDLIARYRSAGFQGYLIKPLRRGSLAERVLAASGAQQAMQPGPPPPPPEDDRVALTRFSGIRVLLVEDNPVGALLAATLLRREGCAVETAASGHEALDALKRARYDLVFMDMRMPGMDGPSAARAIRARGDETPIVALTANAFAEDRRACLEAGMDDHLVKPLELDALRAALARWTNRADRAKVAVA